MIIDQKTGFVLTVKLSENDRSAQPVYIIQTNTEGRNMGILGFGNTKDAWTSIQELVKEARITAEEAAFLTKQADQLDALIIHVPNGGWRLK
jgi:hypothetical protein